MFVIPLIKWNMNSGNSDGITKCALHKVNDTSELYLILTQLKLRPWLIELLGQEK